VIKGIILKIWIIQLMERRIKIRKKQLRGYGDRSPLILSAGTQLVGARHKHPQGTYNTAIKVCSCNRLWVVALCSNRFCTFREYMLT
jgi:hypothetical protein